MSIYVIIYIAAISILFYPCVIFMLDKSHGSFIKLAVGLTFIFSMNFAIMVPNHYYKQSLQDSKIQQQKGIK